MKTGRKVRTAIIGAGDITRKRHLQQNSWKGFDSSHVQSRLELTDAHEQFCRCILEGRKMPVTVEDGLISVQILQALFRADEEHCFQEIPVFWKKVIDKAFFMVYLSFNIIHTKHIGIVWKKKRRLKLWKSRTEQTKWRWVVVRACAVTCVAAAYLKNRKQAIVRRNGEKKEKSAGGLTPVFFAPKFTDARVPTTICEYRTGLWECAARNNPQTSNEGQSTFWPSYQSIRIVIFYHTLFRPSTPAVHMRERVL